MVKRVTRNLDNNIEQHGLMKKDDRTLNTSEKLTPRSQNDVQSKHYLNKREKLLVALIVFLLIMLAVFAVVTGFLYARQADATTQTSEERPTYPCVTKDCVLSATELLNFLDPAVRPCDNFYQYACGGWIKKNPVPAGKEYWNQFTKLEEDILAFVNDVLLDKEIQAKYSKIEAFQKAIAYHKSCMNVDEINRRETKPLDDLIKKFGSWTITGKEWNGTLWNIVKYLAMMRRSLAIEPFFTVFVGADQRNSSVNIIQFRPIAFLGLDRGRLTTNSTDGRRAREVYKEHFFNLTRALGADNASYDDIMDVYKFEITLAQVMSMRSHAYDDSVYKKLTVKELSDYTGTNPINWREFLHQLLFPVTGKEISDSLEVVVHGIDFLRNITDLLKITSNRTLANYMMWRVVDFFYSQLGDKFEEIYKNFVISLDGYWSPTPRLDWCLQMMKEKYFDTPLSRIYVDKYFNGDSKKIAKELVEQIKNAFKRNVLELDWMDDNTKERAVQKANFTAENIGFPDYILDDKMLDEEYKDVTCNVSTYFENEVSLDQAITSRELAAFGKPVDETMWALSPMSLNAYYDRLANKMVFPAAILQSPFYNKRYSKAMLFGGIGSIIAHELTHGFDVDGRRFDMKGDKRNWWSQETMDAFNEKTQCLEKQYSNFTFDGGTIDGEQTLAENIADNGGIKQAFRAYQEWVKRNGEEPRLPGMNLTNDQIFFISFARNWCSSFTEKGEEFALFGEHSPEPWRTNAAVMNFAKFADTFSCPLGTPMNPIKKCEVW